MWDVLSNVTWDDIILVGAALGIFGGTQSLYKYRQAKRNNNNEQFNQRWCNERHELIAKQFKEIKAEISTMHIENREDFRCIFDKLDALLEK